MKTTTAIKELLDSLYLCEKQLTAGQMQFIDSVKKYYKKYHTLSGKQIYILIDIKKNLVKIEPRYTMKT